MSSTRRYKRRRLKKSLIKKVLLLSLVLIIVLCSVLLINNIFSNRGSIGNFITDKTRHISYKKVEDLDIELKSKGFLLYDIETNEVLYARNNSERFFPASLTKLMTMSTVLRLEDNLSNRSSVTNEQVNDLIAQDASLAYITPGYEYTLKDLLAALILPSGADAAKALENYFEAQGINLIEEMNKTADILRLKDSHFTNTTGLHDENLYTCADDLLIIIVDLFKYKDASEILNTLYYDLEDGKRVSSTLSYLSDEIFKFKGGKTGYTPEAGLCVATIYEYLDKSYLVITYGAKGTPREGYHILDSLSIMHEVHIEKGS